MKKSILSLVVLYVALIVIPTPSLAFVLCVANGGITNGVAEGGTVKVRSACNGDETTLQPNELLPNGDVNETVRGNKTTTIGENQTVAVGGNSAEFISEDSDRSLGGNESVAIGLNQSIAVSGNKSEVLGGSSETVIGNSQNVTVSGSSTLGIAKDLLANIAGNTNFRVTKGLTASGKTISINAVDEIVIKTGSASLTMKKNGDIMLKGKNISVKGSGEVNLKGSKLSQN